MNSFEYVTADSFEAATRFLAGQSPHEVLVKAGGIDILDRLKERLATPKIVLNLRQATRPEPPIELRSSAGQLVIHALTTVAEIAENQDVRQHLPALAAAAEHAATPQIRNVATIGGNLCQQPRCWYYRSQDYHCLKKGGATCYAVHGDNRYHAIFGAGACHIVHPSNLAGPLMAYGAAVELVRQADGKPTRRSVTLEDFYRVPANPQHTEHTLEPGELIEEVVVPLAAAGPRSAYVEVREKQSFDWPLVSCAANLNAADQPRIILGAVAPIPWRLKAAEQQLGAPPWTDERIAAVGTKAAQGAEPMAHNAYKVTLVGAVVEDALRAAAAAKREGDA